MSQVSLAEFFAPYPVVLAANVDGPPKIGLVIEGMEITDPEVSDCGRFSVDPWRTYGLNPEQVEALKSVNLALVDAVQQALDAGCLQIQKCLGIGSGDNAGMHFSGGAALEEITRLLGAYMVAEISLGDALVPERKSGDGLRSGEARGA